MMMNKKKVERQKPLVKIILVKLIMMKMRLIKDKQMMKNIK